MTVQAVQGKSAIANALCLISGMLGVLAGALLLLGAISTRGFPVCFFGGEFLFSLIVGVGSLLGMIGGTLPSASKPPPLASQRQIAVTQQTHSIVATKICQKCGTVLNKDMKFCPYCGKRGRYVV